MPTIEDEGDLRFTFPDHVVVRRLEKEQYKPQRLGLVDFLIYEEDRILLLEVKDPSNPKSVKEGGDLEYGRKLPSEINDTYVPQARGSYTILHLMEEDTKPIDYFVVISLPKSWDTTTLSLGLKRRLAKEMKEPWKRQYIRHAAIVPLHKFPQYFPLFSCTRIQKATPID